MMTVMFAARKAKGLTQKELAAKVGVTQPRISAWENGTSAIPDGRRKALSRELGVDPRRLADEANLDL